MTADPNFSAYLNFLQSYQILIYVGAAVGVIFLSAGVVLTFMMRKYVGHETLELEIPKSNAVVKLGSTFAGTTITFSGAIIFCISLYMVKYTIPKPEFKGKNWNAGLEIQTEVDPVKAARVAEVQKAGDTKSATLYVENNGPHQIKGFLVPAEKIRQLSDVGIEGVELSASASVVNPRANKLGKVPIYFVPITEVNKSKNSNEPGAEAIKRMIKTSNQPALKIWTDTSEIKYPASFEGQ